MDNWFAWWLVKSLAIRSTMVIPVDVALSRTHASERVVTLVGLPLFGFAGYIGLRLYDKARSEAREHSA
jgi:hypothetical protein